MEEIRAVMDRIGIDFAIMVRAGGPIEGSDAVALGTLMGKETDLGKLDASLHAILHQVGAIHGQLEHDGFLKRAREVEEESAVPPGHKGH